MKKRKYKPAGLYITVGSSALQKILVLKKKTVVKVLKNENFEWCEEANVIQHCNNIKKFPCIFYNIINVLYSNT